MVIVIWQCTIKQKIQQYTVQSNKLCIVMNQSKNIENSTLLLDKLKIMCKRIAQVEKSDKTFPNN